LFSKASFEEIRAQPKKFIMLQFRIGPVGGDQILASTSIQEMFRPIAPTQSHGSVGIGWFIAPFSEKYTIISKNGGDPGGPRSLA
jgi:hypothetical protein